MRRLALLLAVISCDAADSSAGDAPAVAAAPSTKEGGAAKPPATAKRDEPRTEAHAAQAEAAKAEAPKAEANADEAPSGSASEVERSTAPAEPPVWGEASVPPDDPPEPRPGELAPPTEEEFAAWDRKDPAREKALYAWDKANLDAMLGYWEDLQCFRSAVVQSGEKGFGAEPGSPEDEEWFQFKRVYVDEVDGWQKKMFADHPRILEKSKLVGSLLEATEVVMYTYPKAFNGGDTAEVAEADAHWALLEAKVKKYVTSLASSWPDHDADPAAKAAHAEHCKALLAK